jgi:hypothetical protein
LFADAPAEFASQRGSGDVAGVAMKPAGERTFGAERPGLAGEIGEDRLRDVGRQAGIAGDFAEGDGINEVEVPPDQLGEGPFGTLVHPGANEFNGVVHRFQL